MNKRIVVALGGNALGKTPEEQLKLVRQTAVYIVDLVEGGDKVIVTHGNGPQVGMINLAMEEAHKNNVGPAMPFAECGAMSQGYIGYELQQAIQMELRKREMKRNCVTLVTQVLVDKEDQAFQNPSKPIGSFYTKEEADKISHDSGYVFKEDAGRGYRRVVPSPKPIKVLELNVIKKLIDSRHIVIACGGGGVPVIETTNGIEGIDAVIDKDMTSARLAIDLKANVLLILTAVDQVSINYNTAEQKKIKKMSVAEAKKYIEDNQFAPGSMLPKIKACEMFVNRRFGGKAIITSLNNAKKALKGKKGTLIIK
jgi:carbamate kinase